MSNAYRISNFIAALIIAVIMSCHASVAQSVVQFEDLTLDIPKDVAYKIDHSDFSPTEQLLFVIPPHYFKLYKPHPKDFPVTIMLMVNKTSVPYSRMTDPAEVDHFNNYYITKNLPHHRVGDYEIYEISKLDNIYISETSEFPHTFECSRMYAIFENGKYYCDVGDNLYNDNLFNGRAYILHYQISGEETALSKAISAEIKQFLHGIIKTGVGQELTPNPARSSQ
jgi:hypothetical protein